MFVEVILFVLLTALGLYLLTRENLPDNVPKGPRRFPFLGCFDFVLYASDMRRLRDKYGNIFMMKVGTQYMVYLCNYPLVKEAFSSPHVSDRPHFEFSLFITDGAPAGVIMTNGEQWTYLRKFLLRQMSDLGMGKSYMEDALMHEARKLAKDFGRLVGKPAKFPKSLDICVLNIVWSLVANKAYEYDDKKILDIMSLVRKVSDVVGGLVLPDLFPIIKYLPHFIRRHILKEQLVDELKKKLINFTKENIDEHRVNLDRDNPLDLIDRYLIEMDEQKKNPNISQFLSDEDLATTIFDLFGGGFNATSNTLRWLIYYIAAHPEVQRKLHEEIDAVIDVDAEISLNHKESLPYLEATIYETHRCSSLVTGGIPHQASKDIQLGGHTVPKGAFVIGCQALCHEDPNYWKEPKKFQPERFIDENGKFKPQKESFMPFAIGRRQCLGERLAQMEFYFFSAVLVQKFHFAPPEGCIIDIEPKQTPIFQEPKSQNLIITYRNAKPEE